MNLKTLRNSKNNELVLVIGGSLFNIHSDILFTSDKSLELACRNCCFQGFINIDPKDYNVDKTAVILRRLNPSDDGAYPMCTAFSESGNALLCSIIKSELTYCFDILPDSMVYFTRLNKPFNLFISSLLRHNNLRSEYRLDEDETRVFCSVYSPKTENQIKSKNAISNIVNKINKFIRSFVK